MRTWMRYTVFFVVGAVGYGVLELLWRGRTHWSMLIAGGICFMIFSLIAEKCENAPLWSKALLCALCITTVELVFGILFNLILRMRVWDYSKMPYNFLGQICLEFSVLWFLLSLALVPLADRLNQRLTRQKRAFKISKSN